MSSVVSAGASSPDLPPAFTPAHEQSLLLLLRHALSGQHQAAAARLLEQAEAVPGFASLLLTILRTSSEESVRLMAMICIRNTVRRHWSEGRNNTARLPGVVPPEERSLVRSALLELVVSEPSMKICSQAVATVARICRVNWPGEWADAFTTMIGALNSCWPACIAGFSASASPDGASSEQALRPLTRIVLLLHRVLKELSTKTLAHDRKRFTLLAGDLLAQLVPLWQAAKTKLLSEMARCLGEASSSSPPAASLFPQLKALEPLASVCVWLVKIMGRLMHVLPHVAMLLPPTQALLESLVQTVQQLQDCRCAAGSLVQGLRQSAAASSSPSMASFFPSSLTLESGFEMPAAALVSRLCSSGDFDADEGFDDWSAPSSGGAYDDDPTGGLAKLPCGPLLHKLQSRALSALQDLVKTHPLALAAGGHVKAMSQLFLQWVTASVGSAGGAGPAVASARAFPPPETLSHAVAILTHILDCAQKLLPYQHVLTSATSGNSDSNDEQASLDAVLSDIEEPMRLFSSFASLTSSARSVASAPRSPLGSAGGVAASTAGSNSPVAGFGAATPDFPPVTPAQHELCILSKLTSIDSVSYRRAGALQLLECHGAAFSPASHDGWLQYCVQHCLTLQGHEVQSWASDSAGWVLAAERMAREDGGLRGAGEALLLALVSDETHAVSVCSKLFAYAHSLTDVLVSHASSQAGRTFSTLLSAANGSGVNNEALSSMQAEACKHLLQLEAAHQAAGLAAADAVAREVLTESGFESWFSSRILPLLAVCGLAPELCNVAGLCPPEHVANALVALEHTKGGPISLESAFALACLNPALCSLTVRRLFWMANCCRSVLSPGIRVTLAHLCVAIMTADVSGSASSQGIESITSLAGIFGSVEGSNVSGIAHLASRARKMIIRPGVRLAAASFLHALVEDSSYNAPPLCNDPSVVAAIAAASYSAAGHLSEADTDAQLQCVAIVGSILEKCSPTTIVAIAKGTACSDASSGKARSPVSAAASSSWPSLLSYMPGVWNGKPGDLSGAASIVASSDSSGGGYGGGGGGKSMLRRHVLKTLHTVFSALPFAAIIANLHTQPALQRMLVALPPPQSVEVADLSSLSLDPSFFSVCVPLVSHSIDVRSPDEVYLCKDALELLACILEVAPDAALQDPSFYNLVSALPLLVARDPEHTTLVAEVANAYLLRAGAVMLTAPPAGTLVGGATTSGTALLPINSTTGAATPHAGCAPSFSHLLSALLHHAPARSTPFVYAALDNAVISAVNCKQTAQIGSTLGVPLTQLLLSLVQGDALRKAAAKDEENEEAAAAASRRRKEERLAAAFNKGKAGSGSSGFAPSTATTSAITSLSSAGGTLSSQSTPSDVAARAIGVSVDELEKDTASKRVRDAIRAATTGSSSDPSTATSSPTSSSSSVPVPQMDGDLHNHGAAVLARLWLASEEVTLGLMSSAATSYASLLGACGVFSADLAQIAAVAPSAFPAAGALRLLVWLLDVWLDSFEDVSFDGLSSPGGDGSSSSTFHTTPHAVAMLWRNKLLSLACLSALRSALRLYIDLSASSASLGPSAARFLEEVNVLRPGANVIDAISTLTADAATAAEALQSAVAAAPSAASVASLSNSGSMVPARGSSTASSSSQIARPGLSIVHSFSSDTASDAGGGNEHDNNASRALAAAAMHIPGLHDTPSRRRARAKAKKHLQATLLGHSGAGGGGVGEALIDADVAAAGIDIQTGGDDDGVALAAPGMGLAKALLLTHARSMSDGSGFRMGITAGDDDDDEDGMDGAGGDDDGDDAGWMAGGSDYYGYRGAGHTDASSAGAAIDALLSGIVQPPSSTNPAPQTLNDSAAARYRLLGGKPEVSADIRQAIASSFGELQTMLPPQVWQTSILTRVGALMAGSSSAVSARMH